MNGGVSSELQRDNGGERNDAQNPGRHAVAPSLWMRALYSKIHIAKQV